MIYRYLLAEDYFDTIDIFEQQSSFGGVWNYSENSAGFIDIPQTNPNQPLDKPLWRSGRVDDVVKNGLQHATFTSPMYEQLETNIPHTLMAFTDDTSLQDHQLFPTRETVIRYLENYAEDVKYLVKFQTQVLDVRRISEEGRNVWQVHFRNLQTEKISEKTYDAVAIASGHYTVPTLPDIKGIKEWNLANKGVISHSKFYRRPDNFENKKVIIIGNSASGIDICSQIATVSKYPVLISERSESPLSFAADYRKSVPQIIEFLPPSHGDRAVRFADGRVEADIDAILFCTGYYYSFPFLPSLNPKIISTGDRVKNLYKQLFCIDEPTLAFIGLPSKIIPFRTVEGQGAVVARVWSKRLELPSTNEMREDETNVIAERGSGKSFHVLPYPKDLEYHNLMVDWAKSATDGERGKVPLQWSKRETWLRERFPAIKKAFAGKGEERHKVKTVEELGFDYDAWLREQDAETNIMSW